MDPMSIDFWWSVLAGIVAAVCFAVFWPGHRWLSLRLIDAAVRRLPEKHQEAMREEWHADFEAYPEGIWGLLWALDLIRVANSMAPIRVTQGAQSGNNSKVRVRYVGSQIGREIGRSLLRGLLGSFLR